MGFRGSWVALHQPAGTHNSDINPTIVVDTEMRGTPSLPMGVNPARAHIISVAIRHPTRELLAAEGAWSWRRVKQILLTTHSVDPLDLSR